MPLSSSSPSPSPSPSPSVPWLSPSPLRHEEAPERFVLPPWPPVEQPPLLGCPAPPPNLPSLAEVVRFVAYVARMPLEAQTQTVEAALLAYFRAHLPSVKHWFWGWIGSATIGDFLKTHLHGLTYTVSHAIL